MAKFSGYRMFVGDIEEVDPSEVGPTTDYPIGVDLETFVKWYYRVKKWKLEVNFLCSANAVAADTSTSASLSGYATVDSDLNSALTNESYFSLELPSSTAEELSEHDENESTGSTSFALAIADLSTGFTSLLFLTSFKKSGDLYYPQVGAGFQLNAQASVLNPSDFGDKMKQAFTSYFALPTKKDINWEIDGETFIKTGSEGEYSGGTAGGVTAVAEFTSIKLTPIEYWSYDGTWNTSTGAQLSDPFSYQP